jgi:hypothetical protein
LLNDRDKTCPKCGEIGKFIGTKQFLVLMGFPPGAQGFYNGEFFFIGQMDPAPNFQPCSKAANTILVGHIH